MEPRFALSVLASLVGLLVTGGDARALDNNRLYHTKEPITERSRVQLFARRSGQQSCSSLRLPSSSTTDVVAASAAPITTSYIGSVAVAGAVACSITHCLVIPLDVIKTRMQTDISSAAAGSFAAAAAVFRDAPGRGLLRASAFFNGLPPTALGYLFQGGTKFGGYELLKQRAFNELRSRGGEEMKRTWQLPVMLASAASAEMAATVLLAPWEVLKLRAQTDTASAARGMLRSLTYMVRNEGVGSLYMGLTPIAMRQLPYTMTKLVTYELFVRGAAGAARRAERAFDLPVNSLQTGAIVLAGMLAGAAAAVVSHPADLLLTRVCSMPHAGVGECVVSDGIVEHCQYIMSLGLRGAYSGLAPRLVMTSAMTSIQFTIYESVRSMLGAATRQPTPQAVVIPA